MRGKAWKKRYARRIARRRGYRKTVHGWGDFVGGIVADFD